MHPTDPIFYHAGKLNEARYELMLPHPNGEVARFQEARRVLMVCLEPAMEDHVGDPDVAEEIRQLRALRDRPMLSRSEQRQFVELLDSLANWCRHKAGR